MLEPWIPFLYITLSPGVWSYSLLPIILNKIYGYGSLRTTSISLGISIYYKYKLYCMQWVTFSDVCLLCPLSKYNKVSILGERYWKIHIQRLLFNIRHLLPTLESHLDLGLHNHMWDIRNDLNIPSRDCVNMSVRLLTSNQASQMWRASVLDTLTQTRLKYLDIKNNIALYLFIKFSYHT